MSTQEQIIQVGNPPLTIESIEEVALGRALVALSDEPAWRNRVESSAAYLKELLDSKTPIYGVTTGYGDSCQVSVPENLIHELPLHLTRFHGCGLGKALSEEATLAVMTSRLASLASGCSGIRIELLEFLTEMINRRILPIIPEEGSVGASGDLTPLSYIAAAMIGERNVRYKGGEVPAADALAAEGLQPVTLGPKEGLALMNGTSVMTGLACLAFSRATYLLRMSARITVLAIEAILGNREHFRPELFARKPFPEQARVADWIFAELHPERETDPGYPLQDRYSLRCAPHVLGVLADALPWMKEQIEIELNSANDNPLILGEEKTILHGGHFYGGHIAFVMDSMKNAVANIADLLDRQVALITDQKVNNNLPANLTGAAANRAQINHGFKAVQIAISAWTAEALKLTMPASVFSRSTECHNQDKVSMGTIAARDCLRVLELTEQVAAGTLLTMHQGMAIRLRRGEIDESTLRPEIKRFFDSVGETFEFLDEDRPLETELRTVIRLIREKAWSF